MIYDEKDPYDEPIKSNMGCSPVAAVIIVISILLMSIAMSSCKTVYVPVESVRTEYRDKLLKDSIYLKDSVYIREKGDTVFFTKYSTKYIEKLRVDSFVKRDSIPVPYPVEVKVPVEKKLSWWGSLKMEAGGIALGALLLVLVYLGVKLFKSVKTVGWEKALKLIFKI